MFVVQRYDGFDGDAQDGGDGDDRNDEVVRTKRNLEDEVAARIRDRLMKRRRKEERVPRSDDDAEAADRAERKKRSRKEGTEASSDNDANDAPQKIDVSGLAKIGMLLNQHKNEAGALLAQKRRIAEAFANINAKDEKRRHVSRAESDATDDVAKRGEDEAKKSAVELAKEWGLGAHLVKLLKRHVPNFFPIQRIVIPAFLASRNENGGRPRDLCVSAPTGSGKTLAYVIPVVQELLNRVVCRLRCLVVLPTRELAAQVRVVFERWTADTKLRVGLVTGHSQFSREQREIVDATTGASRVDILVATPGRLLDHIRSTIGFTLEHLRYLVIDEADRLLSQSYQDWIRCVYRAARTPIGADTEDTSSVVPRARTRRPIEPGQATSALLAEFAGYGIRKIVVSATLTRNPRVLANLKLRAPMNFVASRLPSQDPDGSGSKTRELANEKSKRFSTPETLEEKFVVTPTADKVLVLAQLLGSFSARGERALIFTASVDAAHRLSRLLQIMSLLARCEGICDESVEDPSFAAGIDVLEISRQMPQSERNMALDMFKSGDVRILVCTDSLARGIDLPRCHHVINYDPPVYAKTYIHRVGRTARAGRKGTCYTLLRSDQVRHFKNMLRRIDNSFVQPLRFNRPELESKMKLFVSSLELLEKALDADRAGEYMHIASARRYLRDLARNVMIADRVKASIRAAFLGDETDDDEAQEDGEAGASDFSDDEGRGGGGGS